MVCKLTICVLAALPVALPIWAQDTVPLYNVTVIEHSLQAVNYQYRSGPTEIDFRGTVLLSKAKGRATVESNRGRTEIDAKLQGLASPQAFGREYLTYVLWAISPEGAPHNLGEVVANGGNDAHLRVTTDLQAFGMLVTVEPYAAVRQPSDVVVLENQVRPGTIGKIEPIQAKTELLPRGHYVLDKQKSQDLLNQEAPKVSMGEYEQLSQIYQAENAMALARTVNADTLAPDVFAKAQQLLQEAKQKHASKAGTSFVVQSAREAAQTADDARVIALKKSQDDKVANAEQRVAAAQQETQRARAEADAARAETARLRADNNQVDTRPEEPAAPPPPVQPPPPAQPPIATHPAVTQPAVTQPAINPGSVTPEMQFRSRLYIELKAVADTLDTPRGLVVVIPDTNFKDGNLTDAPVNELSRVAKMIGTMGLQITVEGNSDTNANDALSWKRAESVKEALISSGLRSNTITARGLGNSRPTTSNATEAGRIENRRVEILLSGGPIGDTPVWDKAYTLLNR
jgi:outer membrane protein OmpA-like peptidoglycan-associated protein